MHEEAVGRPGVQNVPLWVLSARMAGSIGTLVRCTLADVGGGAAVVIGS
jgi:hypothetical protein